MSRANLRLVAYILADLFGTFAFAVGLAGLLGRRGALIAGFPASPAEAVVAIAGGFAVSAWATLRILQALRDRHLPKDGQ